MVPGRTLAAIAAGAAMLGAAAPPPHVDLALVLAPAPARALGDYGLFSDGGKGTPAPGVTAYTVATPLFSDDAVNSRWVYMPPGTRATYRPTGVVDFPVGTVLVKTFAYPADMRRPAETVRLAETRLLIRKSSGWVANTYVWNEAATAATLTRAGATLDIGFTDDAGRARRIAYGVPNVNQCKECHSANGAVTPIGPKARNLNLDAVTATGPENQLARWTRTGLLTGAPPPGAAPRTAVWTDTHASLADRARAYLDANCGHCHSPEGFASNSGLYLDLEETRATAQGLGKRPVAAGRGSGGLLYAIDPGAPDRSILVYRMGSTEPGVMMPQLGRSLVDEKGLRLVRDYIASLKAPS